MRQGICVKNRNHSITNEPFHYRIRVSGGVSERWVKEYWNKISMVVSHEAGSTTTEMTGEIIDQTALMGLINTLYDTRHVLISVESLTWGQYQEENPEESDSQ